MNDIKVMNHAADNIRILAASMVEKANSALCWFGYAWFLLYGRPQAVPPVGFCYSWSPRA